MGEKSRWEGFERGKRSSEQLNKGNKVDVVGVVRERFCSNDVTVGQKAS